MALPTTVFSGRVQPGLQRGRELGFPTLNLEVAGTVASRLPRGVWAGLAGWAEESERPAVVNIGVYDLETNDQIGQLVDMSTEGIMLVGGSVMKLNTVYQFKIVFPIAIYKDREISFNAVCLWCDKNPDGSSYQAGFQLRDVDPDLKKLLKCLIQGPGFEDSQT